eukprot:4738378-Pleurochrysis_carterae.AAC.2
MIPSCLFSPETVRALAGNYCPSGSAAPVPCGAGRFSPFTNLTSENQCQDCPAGFFCPVGAPQPTPCSAGTYAASENSQRCTPCEGKLLPQLRTWQGLHMLRTAVDAH